MQQNCVMCGLQQEPRVSQCVVEWLVDRQAS